MNYFDGLSFFLCLIPVVLIGGILGYLERPLGRYTLLVSLLFAFLIFSRSPVQMIYLTVYCLWSWLLIRIYERRRKKDGRDSRIYHAVLAFSLIPLAFCKVSPLFHGNIFGFTGISYLTFRVLQIIIEMYDGVVTEITAEDFFSFLLFFPSVSSGPIDRSRRFLADRNRRLSREEYLEMCAGGISSFLVGAVYKFILAQAAWHLTGYLEAGESWYLLGGYAYAYGIYLFFDFAGYSRMAVGISRILGIQTPDNFHLPFLAGDIRDFWDRWHITLSHWFRDYIFTRFVMTASRRKWFHTRLQRACAGFFVNMGIMGIWHGITPGYILYGLYHGLLLALTEVYQKKCPFYKNNKGKQWYKVLSWFVTIQLVMFGFLIFSGRII